MKRPLSQLEADILIGACDEIQELLARGIPSGYGFAIQKMAFNDAAAGRVRCNTAWCGVATDDPAIRMRISRAYASLERHGLIDRFGMGCHGRRITHIAPTREGYNVAKQLRYKSLPNCIASEVPPVSGAGDLATAGPDENSEAYPDPEWKINAP